MLTHFAIASYLVLEDKHTGLVPRGVQLRLAPLQVLHARQEPVLQGGIQISA